MIALTDAVRSLLSPPAPAPASSATAASDWLGSDPWVRLGIRTVVGMVGGLLLLFWLIPINGAVIAAGTVGVDGNYKTLQHLDGGIVSRILVENGDRVTAGDVLVRLDDTVARASLGVTLGKLDDLLVQKARLEAERDRKEAFATPEGLSMPEADPGIASILAAQQALFSARRTSRNGELSVLRERSAQLKGELAGALAQLASRRKEIEINRRELEQLMPLFEKGFITQQRISALRREAARLEGDIGRLEADSGRARSAVAEADLKIAQSEKELTQAVVDELRKVQAAIAELEQTRSAQADRLARTEIRAPVNGRVHALAVHTQGGVVTPASAILQIVPDNERLVVEAQISPREVDKVREGLAAGVRFSAFNAHTTPRLEGRVAKVSPAQITDPQGRPAFTVRVEVPAAEMARLGKSHKLVPGMPAEIFIETGARSILSYLVKPLADVVSLAMREP